MELIGQGLIAIGESIDSIATAAGLIGIAAIAAFTILSFKNEWTVEDIRYLLTGKKNKY